MSEVNLDATPDGECSMMLVDPPMPPKFAPPVPKAAPPVPKVAPVAPKVAPVAPPTFCARIGFPAVAAAMLVVTLEQNDR